VIESYLFIFATVFLRQIAGKGSLQIPHLPGPVKELNKFYFTILLIILKNQ